jgi:hypothetical protein
MYTYLKKTIFKNPYLVDFSLLWAQKNSFPGRHELKKNAFATLVLEFFYNPNSVLGY